MSTPGLFVETSFLEMFSGSFVCPNKSLPCLSHQTLRVIPPQFRKLQTVQALLKLRAKRTTWLYTIFNSDPSAFFLNSMGRNGTKYGKPRGTDRLKGIKTTVTKVAQMEMSHCLRVSQKHTGFRASLTKRPFEKQSSAASIWKRKTHFTLHFSYCSVSLLFTFNLSLSLIPISTFCSAYFFQWLVHLDNALVHRASSTESPLLNNFFPDESLNMPASLSGGEARGHHAYQHVPLAGAQNNKQSMWSHTEVITLISMTQVGRKYFPHLTHEEEARSLGVARITLGSLFIEVNGTARNHHHAARQDSEAQRIQGSLPQSQVFQMTRVQYGIPRVSAVSVTAQHLGSEGSGSNR